MRQEPKSSIKQRIAMATGFHRQLIVLDETGYTDGWCTNAAFTVLGRGFWTDFRDWGFAPKYDREGGDE